MVNGLLKELHLTQAPDASSEIYAINPHLSPEVIANAKT